jgi:uncharacterized protein YabN with tetrapyrrole methylase and pyrophosphatase domain
MLRKRAFLAGVKHLSRSILLADAIKKPWPRSQLKQHAKKLIYEGADDVLFIKQDDDDTIVASLKPGGEDVLFQAVLKAIDKAGWQLLPRSEA